GFRRRRDRQRGRYARRLYREPHWSRAGARRARAGSRPLRNRSARCRSPPRQEAQDLPERRAPERPRGTVALRPADAARERSRCAGQSRPGRAASTRYAALEGFAPTVKPARLAPSVMLAWGGRRILMAFAAGAFARRALPRLSVWPAPFLTFPILVWLVDGAAGGRWGGLVSAAATGWWFGFGYFLVGLYWIGNAFLVDAKTFGWLLPFAVTLMPAGLALFTALGLALARFLWTRGAARVLALAVALTVAEWLRGHVLTGFPWNAFGCALATPLPLAQTGALIGLWGLTFIAVFVYASPAVLTDDPTDSKRRWLAPAVSAVVLAAMAAYGAIRLNGAPTNYVDNVRLRIMQPNLQQDDK